MMCVFTVLRLKPLTLGSSVAGFRYIGKRTCGPVLRQVAIVAHVAAAVIDSAVLDAEHAHVAFAVERDVAGLQRILGIGPDAVESAVEVGRHCAFDLAVADVRLEAVQRRRRAHRGAQLLVRDPRRARRRRLSLRAFADQCRDANPSRCAERATHE
jgi:hypothetical protein